MQMEWLPAVYTCDHKACRQAWMSYKLGLSACVCQMPQRRWCRSVVGCTLWQEENSTDGAPAVAYT